MPTGPRAAAARRLAASAIRQTRNALERRRHVHRRQMALRRLVSIGPRRILMVCLGNICRSPYAAYALARELPGTTFEIASAGFIGPGRPAPDEAREAASGFGVDLGPHRSQRLTTAMLREHDLVVVMEAGQRNLLIRDYGFVGGRILILGDLDPEAIDTRAIPDPFGGSLEDFTRCYERIERCVQSLAAVLRSVSPGRDPSS